MSSGKLKEIVDRHKFVGYGPNHLKENEEFNEKEYFKDYDFYEVYDAANSEKYIRGSHDFGKGVKSYKFSLRYTLSDTLGAWKVKTFYVYAEEELSDTELKLLEPFCNCLWHRQQKAKEKHYPWSPLRLQYYLFPYIPKYVGCLSSGRHAQHTINEARQAYLASLSK